MSYTCIVLHFWNSYRSFYIQPSNATTKKLKWITLHIAKSKRWTQPNQLSQQNRRIERHRTHKQREIMMKKKRGLESKHWKLTIHTHTNIDIHVLMHIQYQWRSHTTQRVAKRIPFAEILYCVNKLNTTLYGHILYFKHP